MTLTTEQQLLVEQRIANEAKSIGVAYFLWLIGGSAGLHRFYLGRASGLFQLALLVAGVVLLAIGSTAAYGFLIADALFVLFDLFWISVMVRDDKDDLRRHLQGELSGKR